MPVTTYIKLDRSIREWRWYKDANVARVYFHLLLSANFCDCGFENITIHRGELATSQASLADAIGLTVQIIRTALKKLRDSGEITITRYARFSVITILSYDKYQSAQQSANSQATVNQQSSNSQATVNQQATNNNIRSEEVNNGRSEEVNNGRTKEVCVPADGEKNTPAPLSALQPENTRAYGKGNNVYLTEAQYREAAALYGNRTERLLNELSLKISINPKRYPVGTHAEWLTQFAEHDRCAGAKTNERKYDESSFLTSKPSYDIEKAMEKAVKAPTSIKRRRNQSLTLSDKGDSDT